jgi:hypothetical protein
VGPPLKNAKFRKIRSLIHRTLGKLNLKIIWTQDCPRVADKKNDQGVDGGWADAAVEISGTKAKSDDKASDYAQIHFPAAHFGPL